LTVYAECWDERGRSKVETKQITLLNSKIVVTKSEENMQLATTDLNSIMLFAYQFTSENNYGALTTTSLPLRISKFCNDILLIEEASLDTYSTK